MNIISYKIYTVLTVYVLIIYFIMYTCTSGNAHIRQQKELPKTKTKQIKFLFYIAFNNVHCYKADLHKQSPVILNMLNILNCSPGIFTHNRVFLQIP